MKSIVNNNNITTSKPFPKLMKLVDDKDLLIVLFTGTANGTVIANNVSYYKIGEHSGDWTISSFEDFEGSVILSND